MNTGRLTVLLAAAALAGGCTKTLMMDTVTTAIKAGLVEQTGITFTSVECPPSREAKAGDTFECTASSAAGSKATITITQADDSGKFDWKLSRSEGLLNLTTLQTSVEADLKGRFGGDPKVDCGGAKFKEAKPGDALTCTVTTGDERATVAVTVKDAQGNVHWEVQEQQDPPDPPGAAQQ